MNRNSDHAQVGLTSVGPSGVVSLSNDKTKLLISPVELNLYSTFFDELCFIMIGFDRGQPVALNYYEALGCRHRLELSMVAPELNGEGE